jgi:predicted nucleic acid-binding protein
MRSLSQPAEMLYISAVILAEIRLDIERVAGPGRRPERNDWRTLRARPMFERRVLPVSEGNMLRWRLLIEKGRKTVQAISQTDLMSGAIALEYGLAVVSSVTSDYEKARVPAVNPWLAAAGL